MGKILEKVEAFVDKYEMIREHDILIAGVSGGADSICLFWLLKELQKKRAFSFVAVHVNHQLRGQEARRDEEFVRNLCQKEEIPCYVVKKDVMAIAKEEGISTEEAGRNARYEAFSMIQEKVQGTKIVLAHHQDDLAETMLHHLARGTGLAGLCSLRPVSGKRIRPLLCLSRKEIEEYLIKKEKTWQTDSTNLEDDYTRNRIRHHVLDYLREEINPQTAAHMAQTALELEQMECYLEEEIARKADIYVKKEKNRIFLESGIKTESEFLRKRLLFSMLKQLAGSGRDLTRQHVEAVEKLLNLQVGKQSFLPYGIVAERTYDGILMRKEQDLKKKKEKHQQKKEEVYPLKIPGITKIDDFEVECTLFSNNFQRIQENKYTKWLDYDMISGNMEVRHRRAGDRICVHSSGGSKKLKDFLIDRKIPQQERDQLWLLAVASDILWIVSDRISQRYKVTETTKNIICIQIRGGEFHE